MLLEYIGESKVAFENGTIYEAREEHDDFLGDCYAILDESDEWYLYRKSFVEKYFRKADL